MPGRLDPYRTELQRMQQDAKYTATAYFIAEERNGARYRFVGVTSAVLATAAAASVFAPYPPLTGTLALLAGALTAYLTVRRPDQDAAAFLSAGRRMNALAVECRQARELTLNADSEVSVDDAEALVRQQQAVINQIHEGLPGVPEKFFEKAQEKIKQGHFEHDVDMATPPTSIPFTATPPITGHRNT